jgi:ribosome-binding protein aMBF1 (putative translation factor)
MADYTSKPQGSQVLIYVLLDPRNLKIRYIGKTTQPLKRRLYGHIASAKRPENTYTVVQWIRKLLALELKPSIHLLEVADIANWANRERHWIAHGRNKGWALLNASNGGETTSGLVFSETTLEKMSLRHRGERNVRARLTEADVYEIREEYAKGQTTLRDIGARYNVRMSNIQMIVRGHTWRHVGGTIVPKNFNAHQPVTMDMARAIRCDYEAGGISQEKLAIKYSIGHSSVSKIIRGERWLDDD